MTADPDATKRQYFALIAPRYASVTGNSSRDLFGETLKQRDLAITSESNIHDNAAGPGTATEVLISWYQQHDVSPSITVTDYVPAMIESFEKIRAQQKESIWQKIDAKVVNYADLGAFPDNSFTHSICNFSVFAFTHPRRSLQEIYRTLKPGGIALITTWKRFAISDLLAVAQDIVKGEEWGNSHRVPVNGPEYIQEGYLASLVKEAEWDQVEAFSVSSVMKESDDWDGIYGFMVNSPIKVVATRDWGEEELARWPEAIRASSEREKYSFGGVLFEGWAVIARK